MTGNVVGGERKVKRELDDVRLYIAEGVAEAEACGDVEMQAEFMIEAVNLNLLEGKPVTETKSLLKVCIQQCMKLTFCLGGQRGSQKSGASNNIFRGPG